MANVNNMYVALDFPSWEKTETFISKHDIQGVPVKVGMELFYREGPDVIKRLKENQHPIFLDLKLHDIPTTVFRAMRNIAELEIDLVNVHALGGMEMMKQAKAGLHAGAHSDHETKLIAVTILTSFDKKTMNQELLLPGELADQAVHLAKRSEEHTSELQSYTTLFRSNIAELEIDLVNVHALGGMEMMKQAKAGLHAGAHSDHETKLIAVTILTSFDKKTMNQELLLPGELADQAVHLAKLAKQSEVDGVVCSVHEAEVIKAMCGQDFITVTPGIRLDASGRNDQKRVATPHYAREHHADRIVIGRSITQSEDPREAYERAIKEWSHETEL